MTTYNEPARDIPVSDRAAVVVGGGSPTGVAAAVAAARQGADVLLVERYGCFGGQMVTGLVMTMGEQPFFDDHHRQIVGGFARELVERLISMGGADAGWDWDDPEERRSIHQWLDPEAAKVALGDLAYEAGVRVLFDTWIADVIMEGRRARGIVVENKSGRSAILGEVLVDATGDGDMAARAGAEFEHRKERFNPALFHVIGGVDIDATLDYLESSGEEFTAECPPGASLDELRRRRREGKSFHVVAFGSLMNRASEEGWFCREGHTFYGGDRLSIHWLREGAVHLSGVQAPCDALDVREMSRVVARVRRQNWQLLEFCRANVPGFARAYMLQTPPSLSVRETRSIRGLHELTNREVLDNTAFDDVIALAGGHDVFRRLPCGHQIPYRALVPAGVDGMLVAGRCVSTEGSQVREHSRDPARNAMRGIVPCICTGQAAGVAAAMAAQCGATPAALDVSLLQENLRSQGVILP